MRRWEYKTAHINKEPLTDFLTRLGMQGWRYIRTAKGGKYLFEREFSQGGRVDERAEFIMNELSPRARELVMGIISNMGDDGRAVSIDSLKDITIGRLQKTRNVGKIMQTEIVTVFRKNEIFIT